MPESRLQLAQALGIQAVSRNMAGTQDVIEAADESVQLYREFDGAPEVLTALASLLGLRGQHLAIAGRFPEAVDALRESAFRFTAVSEPQIQLVFEHIDVERNLTISLASLGDYPEALQHVSAALDLMRPLASENPRLVQLIVETLELRSDLLAELGRHDEAAQAMAEARQWQS